MSELLTFEDLEEAGTLGVTEIEWMGKRTFVRDLSYDAAKLVHDSLGEDDPDREASQNDIKLIVALMLCKEDGSPLNEDVSKTIAALGKLGYTKIMDLWAAVQNANGMDIEAEEKNLKAVP